MKPKPRVPRQHMIMVIRMILGQNLRLPDSGFPLLRLVLRGPPGHVYDASRCSIQLPIQGYWRSFVGKSTAPSILMLLNRARLTVFRIGSFFFSARIQIHVYKNLFQPRRNLAEPAATNPLFHISIVFPLLADSDKKLVPFYVRETILRIHR